MLSHSLWRTAFGSDPGVVDSSVLLGEQSYRIAGVASARFAVPRGVEAWILGEANAADRERRVYATVGLVVPGLALERAGEALARVPAVATAPGDVGSDLAPAEQLRK